MRTLDRVRRLLIRCEPIAALALLLPFRWQGTEAEMRSIVQEFAERTAEECGSADRLFTDGTIDAGVEVAAAMKGKRLKTISMTSGGTPLEVHLRQRAAVDEEDRSLLGASAADALRTWIADRPERMTNLAVQLGFEMWRHNRSKMPTCGGFVARPDGAFAPGEREAGVKAAHALGCLGTVPVACTNHCGRLGEAALPISALYDSRMRPRFSMIPACTSCSYCLCKQGALRDQTASLREHWR